MTNLPFMTLLGTVGFLPAVLRHVLLLLLISGCVVLFLMDRHYAMKNEVSFVVFDFFETQKKYCDTKQKKIATRKQNQF